MGNIFIPSKLSNVTSARLIGRTTASVGESEELDQTAALQFLGIEAGADVTDTTNVTAAGALMDSEVLYSLSGIKTLTVPDNTTITAFAKTFLNQTAAIGVRTAINAASTTHAVLHQDGGSDELNVAGLSGRLVDSQYVTTQDDGVGQGQAHTLNFADSTVSVVAGVATITPDALANSLSNDEYAAINGATTPTAANLFLTESDIGSLTNLNALITDGPLTSFDEAASLPTAAILNRFIWRTSDDTLHRDMGTGNGWVQVGVAGVEANNLEATITGILDNEVFVGNGANSGTYIAIPTSQALKFNGSVFSQAALADLSDGGSALTSEANNLEGACGGIAANEVPVGSSAGIATYTATTGSGSVVRAGSPTLTTPNIGTPTISSFASAGHNHTNAAGGGQLAATALTSTAISTLTTAEPAPTTGDLLLIETPEGIRKLDIANLPPGSESNNLESAMGDALQHEVPVGTTGGGAAVYRALSNGAVAYNTTTETFSQAGVGNLSGTPTGTGDIVLENSPTIVTPTIASMTNAQHSHADAAGGGTISYTVLTNKPTIPTVPNPTPMKLFVESPATNDVIILGRCDRAYTIASVYGVIDSGTSVVVTISSGASRATADQTNVNGQTVSSTTTGTSLTVANSAFDTADWVWVTIGTVTGTVDGLNLTIAFS